MEQIFITRDEAALLLRISLPTLQKRLAEKAIPSVKVGGRVLIPRAAIEAIANSATPVGGAK